MKELITTDWKNFIFNDNTFDSFINIIEKMYNENNKMLPKKIDIFKCFNMFNVSDLKIVILGQDPYHTKGKPDGLCFSVSDGSAQPSVRNIFKELKNDLNIDRNKYDLTDWAKQGILLLNTSLSVEEGKPNSHFKLWKPFTNYVINKISNEFNDIIFILLGNKAMSKKKLIDINKHYIIECGHPSPLSVKKFIGSKLFTKCNNYLLFINKDIISWG